MRHARGRGGTTKRPARGSRRGRSEMDEATATPRIRSLAGKRLDRKDSRRQVSRSAKSPRGVGRRAPEEGGLSQALTQCQTTSRQATSRSSVEEQSTTRGEAMAKERREVEAMKRAARKRQGRRCCGRRATQSRLVKSKSEPGL